MQPPKNKASKPTGAQQVQAFLSELEHPLKPEIEAVHQIILQANPDLTEQIKWNAPSFCYQGHDRITFNLQGKGFFRLIFHCGAKVNSNPVAGQLIEDTSGMLEWAAPDRAIARFSTMSEIKQKEAALTELVNKWLAAAG